MKQFYKVSEVAEVFNVSDQTIRNWIEDDGRFPNTVKMDRVWLITADDLQVEKEKEAQKLVKQLESLGFQSTLVSA